MIVVALGAVLVLHRPRPMKLSSCPSCRGLLPARALDCPHCEATLVASPIARAAKVLVGMATGGAVAMTLMACYGMPPCEEGETGNCIDEGVGGAGGRGGEEPSTTTSSTGGEAPSATTGSTGGEGGSGDGGAGGQGGGG